MFKVYVYADSSGNAATNALLFASEEEAEAYAVDLASRWTAVREWEIRPASAEEIAGGVAR